MIVPLAFMAAVNTKQTPQCEKAFNQLVAVSEDRAKVKQYTEAAALQEAAAHVYDTCGKGLNRPNHGLFPFDGVWAYGIATWFWHLSGNADQAKRTLLLAEQELSAVRRSFPNKYKGQRYLDNLYDANTIVQDEKHGHWPIFGAHERR